MELRKNSANQRRLICFISGSGNSDQASKNQRQGISSTFNHRSAISTWMVQFGCNFEVGHLGRCRIMIRWGFPQLRVNCCSLWGRSWHFCHHSFVIQMLSNFTVANNLWVLLTGPLTSEMTAHAYYANENNMIGMYRSEQFECQYYLKPQLWIYKSSSFLLHLDELSRRNISIVNLHPWSHEDGSACISPQKNYKSHNKRQVIPQSTSAFHGLSIRFH